MFQLVGDVFLEDNQTLLFDLETFLSFARGLGNHVLEVVDVVYDDSLAALRLCALVLFCSLRCHFKFILRVIGLVWRWKLSTGIAP